MLRNLFSAAIKTVIVPVAIVRDVIAMPTGLSDESLTADLIEGVGDNIQDAMDNFADGDII